MAWQVILPIIASVLQGAIGSSMAASSAASENNRQALAARTRRAELQPIIDQLSEARDYFGVEENLVRDFSRASDQMAAQSAASGMTNAGSGGLDQVRGDMLGSALAELAQFKTQDENARQQMLAEILGDPSLYAGVGADQNVGQMGAMGFLGGAAAGAGTALNSFISTPEGLKALENAFSPRTAPLVASTAPAPATYTPAPTTFGPQPTNPYGWLLPPVNPQPMGLPR